MVLSKARLHFAIELAELERLLLLSRSDYPRAKREWTQFKTEKGLLS